MKPDEQSVNALKSEVERHLSRLLAYVDVDPEFMNECIDTATRSILEGRSDAMDAAIDKLAKEVTRQAKKRGLLK